MNLELVFKLSLYCLAALSAWILGVAEGGWIPYATLPLVVIGYFWTESGKDRSAGLNETLSSLCGFLALATAVNEYFGPVAEGKLLAGTHLLVFLMWILLLQPKTNRRYWLLLAIGVLQLALSSVLTTNRASMWFGFCALTYVCGAIWTMSVFSVFRYAMQFASTAGMDVAISSEFNTSHGEQTMTDVGGSRSLGSVQNEHGSAGWLSTGFAGGVGITIFLGLFVSSLFFVLIPRVWISSGGISADDSTAKRNAGRTGFTENVQLGDMGSILESLDPVLELELFDNDKPLDPVSYAQSLGYSEPLLRGAVLSTYETRSWKQDQISAQHSMTLFKPTKTKLVRQDIHLRAIGTDVVFSIGYLLGIDTRKDLKDKEGIRGRYELATGILHRTVDQARREIRYSAYTELPNPNVPAEGIVEIPELNRRRYQEFGYLTRIKLVPKGLERLSDLARRIVEDEHRRQNKDLSDKEKVRAIETYLRDSGEYRYSINLSIKDPSIDPVEDFLFNRKMGHCEYFASALVLMVRSVGIPARLISGFKGGIYDAEKKVLEVQQRHAHTWCEAWINDKAWITLDATPSEQRTAIVEAVAANRSVWTDVRTQLVDIWSANVVDLSLDKQKKLIYLPIHELIKSIGNSLRDLWVSPDASLFSFWKLLVNPLNWFSLKGAATLFVIVASVWIAARHAFRLRKFWKSWRWKQSKIRARRLVEFYERFAKLMNSCGLNRSDFQTQREFATQVAEALQFRLQPGQLQSSPAEISDLYYRVRFGDETLPDAEARRADELLSNLEALLKTPRPSNAV